MKRQKFEVMLPLLYSEAGVKATNLPGDMRKQFEVGRPLAESVLRALKAQDGLEGLLKPKFLDVVDAVGRLHGCVSLPRCFMLPIDDVAILHCSVLEELENCCDFVSSAGQCGHSVGAEYSGEGPSPGIGPDGQSPMETWSSYL